MPTAAPEPGSTTVGPAPAPARLHYLDWLRIIAVLILLVFHSHMVFDPSHLWLIKSPEQWTWLVPIDRFVSSWRLSLLFLVSGFGIAFALGRRPVGTYLRDRVQRLIVPFIVGVLFLVPPQVYIQRLVTPEPGAEPVPGSLLAFFPGYWLESLQAGHFRSEHVWYLRNLFIFSVVALPFFLWWRRHKASTERLIAGLAQGRRLLLLGLPLLLVAVALHVAMPFVPVIGSALAARDDFIQTQTGFLIFFVYGFLIAGSPALGQAAMRNRHMFLGLAIVAYICWQLTRQADHALLELVANKAQTFLWVTVLLGYAQIYLNRSSPFLRYGTELVLPFYVFQQTVIVIVAYYVLDWPLHTALHYLLIVAGSFLITMLLCELVRRQRVLRFLFGMAPRRSQVVKPAPAQALDLGPPQRAGSQDGGAGAS